MSESTVSLCPDAEGQFLWVREIAHNAQWHISTGAADAETMLTPTLCGGRHGVIVEEQVGPEPPDGLICWLCCRRAGLPAVWARSEPMTEIHCDLCDHAFAAAVRDWDESARAQHGPPVSNRIWQGPPDPEHALAFRVKTLELQMLTLADLLRVPRIEPKDKD